MKEESVTELHRHKVFLRNTSTKNADGRFMVNIPDHIWKTVDWKLNDNLILETVQMGMEHNIIIRKED
tara:strand:- start:30151 stop:30354 length:204 start_codon:yes stop_codon:yes gene_type:complete